jgi:hypothetical protein
MIPKVVLWNAVADAKVYLFWHKVVEATQCWELEQVDVGGEVPCVMYLTGREIQFPRLRIVSRIKKE